MEKEIWKPVKGYEDWAEVSNLGQIHYYAGKSIKYPDERWTYGGETSDGYLYACIGGVKKGVHVWVYMTFNDCDIPKGLQVNHIDEDKHNNRLDNLNLMTPSQNVNWGTGNARRAEARKGKPTAKAVQALDPTTMEVVMEFPSTREAGRQGFIQSHVSACCLGKHKTHKGLLWQFKKG